MKKSRWILIVTLPIAAAALNAVYFLGIRPKVVAPSPPEASPSPSPLVAQTVCTPVGRFGIDCIESGKRKDRPPTRVILTDGTKLKLGFGSLEPVKAFGGTAQRPEVVLFRQDDGDFKALALKSGDGKDADLPGSSDDAVFVGSCRKGDATIEVLRYTKEALEESGTHWINDTLDDEGHWTSSAGDELSETDLAVFRQEAAKDQDCVELKGPGPSPTPAPSSGVAQIGKMGILRVEWGEEKEIPPDRVLFKDGTHAEFGYHVTPIRGFGDDMFPDAILFEGDSCLTCHDEHIRTLVSARFGDPIEVPAPGETWNDFTVPHKLTQRVTVFVGKCRDPKGPTEVLAYEEDFMYADETAEKPDDVTQEWHVQTLDGMYKWESSVMPDDKLSVETLRARAAKDKECVELTKPE